jgi:hypothetical protein
VISKREGMPGVYVSASLELRAGGCLSLPGVQLTRSSQGLPARHLRAVDSVRGAMLLGWTIAQL